MLFLRWAGYTFKGFYQYRNIYSKTNPQFKRTEVVSVTVETHAKVCFCHLEKCFFGNEDFVRKQMFFCPMFQCCRSGLKSCSFWKNFLHQERVRKWVNRVMCLFVCLFVSKSKVRLQDVEQKLNWKQCEKMQPCANLKYCHFNCLHGYEWWRKNWIRLGCMEA